MLRDARNIGDGLAMLRGMRGSDASACFLDPQYRGVLDHLAFGNEGARQGGRVGLPQMGEDVIADFVSAAGAALRPSGHLFLWVDKFEFARGVGRWAPPGLLEVVDWITWDKGRIGMGFRTRRRSEVLVVLQRPPRRARGAWSRRDIPDVWAERLPMPLHHPHAKPVGLQAALVEAVTRPGDLVLDPAAGGYSVLEAVRLCPGRHFLGCDLRPPPGPRPRSPRRSPRLAAAPVRGVP